MSRESCSSPASRTRRVDLPVLLLLATLLLAGGCHRYLYVYLSPEKFTAQVPQTARQFSGQRVYLDYVNNQDSYASSYYPGYNGYVLYYDHQQRYLAWFFLESFRKVLGSAGLMMVEKKEDAPFRLQVTLLLLTDQKFRYQVELFRGQQRLFARELDVPGTPDHVNFNPDALEQNAYQMANAAMVKVLSDPEFVAALAPAAAQPPAEPPPDDPGVPGADAPPEMTPPAPPPG